MNDKCGHCPVSAGMCRGQSPRYGHLCRRAAQGHPVELRAIVDLSAGGIPPEPAPPPPPPEPPRPAPDQVMGELKIVAHCPHRDERTDCGCGGLARCSLGKGRDGLVNHQDCLACLRAGDPQ
ncbi:hypothetical protein [Aquisphaera insulae]|uniref:hypothetical protein n=1 Tax=Aquisphaera insulae TaxID=2712864 RepID=UPI0013EAD6D2|nr:hypothetical protein [Aquisphaera insulae]